MKTNNKVEQEFQKLHQRVMLHKKEYCVKNEINKACRILSDLKRTGTHWVMAWELCNTDYKLISGEIIRCNYKMSTRLSDAVRLYPGMYTSRSIGRFKAFRAL